MVQKAGISLVCIKKTQLCEACIDVNSLLICNKTELIIIHVRIEQRTLSMHSRRQETVHVNRNS